VTGPIRILVTLSEFMFGSKFRNVRDLVRGIDQDRFSVEIAGLDVGDEATEAIHGLGVPVYQLRTTPTPPYSLPRLVQVLGSPLRIADRKHDVVHSFLYQSLFTEPLLFRGFSGARYVYTKSNLQWDNHRVNWALKSRLSDRIISISRATDDLLTSKGFGDKIRRIYLGIDTTDFRSSEDDRVALRARLGIAPSTVVFGCAAQFVEWKEHLTVLTAFEELRRQGIDAHLVFVGPHHNDDYYRAVASRIATSPACREVTLLGTLADMRPFYSAIDCFVLVSRNETFGYVYVEAMSCGRPVIACRAGGPLEIVADNETGVLVQMSSPPEVADAMCAYAADRVRMSRHGTAGRQRAKSLFSSQQMVRKFEDLYLDVVGALPPRQGHGS
jgi:glycosyltransferase involved in cell wall biosynthesis